MVQVVSRGAAARGGVTQDLTAADLLAITHGEPTELHVTIDRVSAVAVSKLHVVAAPASAGVTEITDVATAIITRDHDA